MDVSIESARERRPAGDSLASGPAHVPRAAIEQHVDATVVAREGARIVGCAAVERYGAAGLLRSVAVDPRTRGSGLGSGSRRPRWRCARARGVRTVYLLTETAADFFPRFGFHPIARDGRRARRAAVGRIHGRLPRHGAGDDGGAVAGAAPPVLVGRRAAARSRRPPPISRRAPTSR